MITTFYEHNALDTPVAYIAALVIGVAFGFILERAGFGSSRRLAGVFYFRDMAVIKVMFTGLISAMLILLLLRHTGVINLENVHFLPTYFKEQILGGLLFGVGFVMGGWCPGTGAVGLASGKVDAFVFIGGVMLGSILYNESFPLFGSLIHASGGDIRFIYDEFGMPPRKFAFYFTLVAIVSFWMSESVERIRGTNGQLLTSWFLPLFSITLAGAAFAVSTLAIQAPALPTVAEQDTSPERWEPALPKEALIGTGSMAAEELADRIMAGDEGLIVVDIREREDFDRFHLRGAIHVLPAELRENLAQHKVSAHIVLYSSGETLAARARDALASAGFARVSFLADGLQGFMEQCLKPSSLRGDSVEPQMVDRIQSWRGYFGTP